MANNNDRQFLAEGASMSRPPAFTGEDYPYWKDRMEMYIKSTHYRLWNIITYGDTPTIRPEDQWTQDDFTIIEMNVKAKYTLTCALSKSEYNKVCRLNSAKEIWDSLAINYEGTEDVRLRKAATLTRQYELFTMHDGESVDDMFGRLQVLLNNLDALGQSFSKAQINLKILDAFPKEWEAKTTAVQECKDMKTLAWDELLGILRCHEVVMQSRKPSTSHKSSAALTSGEPYSKRCEKKNASRALKSQTPESDDDTSGSEESTDDDVALMSRKFKQMLKKRGKFQRPPKHKGDRVYRKEKADGGEIVCYECRKPGHMKADCPKLKKRSKKPFHNKKKKSLLATWDDSDSSGSSSSDEEIANLCLMADAEEPVEVQTLSESCSTSCSSSDDEEDEMPYDVLLQNCHMLTLQCKKYKNKFKSVLAECTDVRKTNDDLNEKIKALETSLSQAKISVAASENSIILGLKKDVACLTKDFGKFLESSDTLSMMLNVHQHPFDGSGLGLVQEKSQSNFESESGLYKCKFCGKSGHPKFRCFLKKKQMSKRAKESKSKGSSTVWVPQSDLVPVSDLLGRKRPGFQLVPGQWMLATHDGKKVYVPRPKST